MPDRFARSDGNDSPCGGEDWCGGTLRGIIEHLDYIQGMGFDCVWITPVVENFKGIDPLNNASGYHGYWAYNFYNIDSHFGTPQDMKDLTSELHNRGMCLVYDMVMNHVGPIHKAEDVAKVAPFNKPEHYHTLNIGDLTFDQYAAPGANGSWPPPTQALWTGAQCWSGPNKTCNCYTCERKGDESAAGVPGLPVASGSGDCSDGAWVWDPESPCPPDPVFSFCMAGDFCCTGYSEEVTQKGWFYDLGDLQQENDFVRQGLKDWAAWFVKTYDVDVIRLDTASYVPLDFLSELQLAVGDVPILGEVTATNLTFHASFQANPPPTGDPTLAGVLNFPLYYAASPAFCGTWWPYAQNNLTWLAYRMQEQQESDLYRSLDLLGNFPDNHDTNRAMADCEGDLSKVNNLIAWTMMARGIPIIYYGTEVLMREQRNSLWNYGWKVTDEYHFLRTLNRLRKQFYVGTAKQRIVNLNNCAGNAMGFVRGTGWREVWVFVNNLPNSTEEVRYCPEEAPAPPKKGSRWVNALSGLGVDFDAEGCFATKDTKPVIIVQVRKSLDKTCQQLWTVWKQMSPELQSAPKGREWRRRIQEWGCRFVTIQVA